MSVQKSPMKEDATRPDFLLRGLVGYMKRACCNSQTRSPHETSCIEGGRGQ